MSTSLISNIKNDNNLMIQSLDPNLLSSNTKSHSSVHDVSSRSSNNSIASINQSNGKPFNFRKAKLLYSSSFFFSERQGNPLAAASKMVPVPESLMSPDCPPSNTVQRNALPNNNSVHSSGYSNLPNNKFAKSKGKTNSYWKKVVYVTSMFFIVSSPKNIRNASTKRQEKSPNLNVTRKTNQNIVSSLRISNTSGVNQSKAKAAAVIHAASPNDSNAASSDDDSDHINTDKLKTIRNKAAQRYVLRFE